MNITVNFGLVTKKSIIHPRPDSSNKSARFSLSSEKSYPNGSGMPTRQPCSTPKDVIMNDDIEKRVFVNKDGSLSVELKVHFRLVNEEILQWSTEIKKLPINTSEIGYFKNPDPQYLPDKVEYSDPDYNSACEAEGACALTVNPKDLDESYCQNCCSHSQGYDIWKNPAHEDNGTKSSCSSRSSHKMRHYKTYVDSVCTNSRSSEEYTTHVVEKSSCFEQTVMEGQTEIKYCSVSCCCSKHEVTAATSTLNCNIPIDDSCERNTKNICQCQIRTPNFTEIHQKGQDYFQSNWSQSISEQDTQCLSSCNSCPPENIDHTTFDAHTSKPTKNRCIHMVKDVPPLQKAYPDVDETDCARSFESHCCQCNFQDQTTTAMTPDRLVGVGETSQTAAKSRTKENGNCAAIIDVKDAQESTESDGKYTNICVNTRNSGKSSKFVVCTCSGTNKSNMSKNIQVVNKDVMVKSSKSTHCNYPSIKPNNVKHFQNHTPHGKKQHNGSESVMSDLSDVSSGSKQSKASNPTSHVKSLPPDLTHKKEIITNISVQSNESKTNDNKQVGAAIPEVEKRNAQASKKSTECIAPALNLHSQEQDPSAMSAKVHSFKDSVKSNKITNNIKEPADISPTSLSLGLDMYQENKDSENLNVTPRSSKVSEQSNACSERDSKFVLNQNNTPTGKAKERQNTDRNAHFLPVSSPKRKTHISTPSTPKSLISTGTNNRAQSTISVHSKASLKSGQSGKWHCLQSNSNVQEENYKCEQNLSSDALKVSPTPSSPEPLSPPSTASVSLGFAEEETEGSMSSRSKYVNKNKCSSKKSALDPAPESSVAKTNKHKNKTARSIGYTIAISNLSHVVEDQSEKGQDEKATSTVLLAKTQSRMSTTARQQCLSERSCPKSHCNGSHFNEFNLDRKECKGGQAVNETLSKSSSIFSQIELISGKATSAGAYKDKIKCHTKSNKRSSSSLGNKDSNKAACYSDEGSFAEDIKTCKQEEHNSVEEIEKMCVPPTIHLHVSGLEVPYEKGTRESGGSRSNSSSTTNKHQKLSANLEHKAKIINENQGQDELMPFILPSASPTEVINNWLRNIPINGHTYEMEEEFIDKHVEEVHQIPPVLAEVHFQNEIEETGKQRDFEPTESRCEDPFHQDETIICDKPDICNVTHFTTAHSDFIISHKLSKEESSANHCQSSRHVKKLLVSPKLERCNSLPEFSSAFIERQLGTINKGLLDCLANLHVIDSDFKQDRGERYNEILSVLQSLWLCEHYKTDADTSKLKDQCWKCNLKSSSGVDLSIGSIGSAKGNINGGMVQQKATQSKITSIAEQKAGLENQEDMVIKSKYDSLSTTTTNVDISPAPCDPLTPDIAERVRCSPENNKLDKGSQKEGLEGIKFIENTVVAETFSNKTSAIKSMTIKKHSPENAKLGASSLDQTGELTNRVSHDPKPVWVLGLLKKIEQQFMSHYADAVEEFKVKWDLNDSETLNTMIYELKEEVHKRIQSTINRELQKIHSRVGRTPRPPMSTLSRDSSIQTEQRRRQLKVMQNKLGNISLSRSEDLNTGSGIELSKQRSDDEYCPCDTCLKKKMVCKVVRLGEPLSSAPVLKDFDLKKILQKKKDHLGTTMQGQARSCNGQDEKNLEVVPEQGEAPYISPEDKNRIEAAAFRIHTKYKNVPVNLDLGSENQNAEVVVSSNKAEAVQKVLFDDANKSQETLEEQLNKKTGGEKTEIRKETSVESANGKDEGEKNKADTCISDEMSENETGKDLEAKNDHPDEEAKIKNCEITEKYDVKKADMKNINAKLEAELPQKEEIEWQGDECKATVVEVTITEENRQSVQLCETSGELVEQAETQYDWGKSNETPSVDSKDSETISNDYQGESEAEEDLKRKEFKQHDVLSGKGLVSSMQVHKECEDEQKMELKNEKTNKKYHDIYELEQPRFYSKITSDQNQDSHSDYLRTDNINPGETGQICGDPDPRLLQQITKTSIESQPGSFEGCRDLKKLNERFNFMETSESQDDIMVGTSKASVFSQSEHHDSSSLSNKYVRKNVTTQCQVSDTIKGISTSTNKTTGSKQGDLEMDDLDF